MAPLICRVGGQHAPQAVELEDKVLYLPPVVFKGNGITRSGITVDKYYVIVILILPFRAV